MNKVIKFFKKEVNAYTRQLSVGNCFRVTGDCTPMNNGRN
jgi:hypothetical protein